MKTVLMNRLAKLQHTFQDSVLHTEKRGTMSWIGANGRADPNTQLSVYSYAYRARLEEVLANDFPAVLTAIGGDEFTQLADRYIHAYPSHYFSLRDFGRHMPDFISGLIEKNETYQGMYWLYELALFEWTLGQAFDAADDELFSEQDLTAIAPENWPNLQFHFHPSVHRLDLEWNVPEMWRILTGDNPTEVAPKRIAANAWLVWRDCLVTRFRSIQTDEQLALDMSRAGGSFYEVCDALAVFMSEDEVPLRAAGLLKGWIVQGLINKASSYDKKYSSN